MVDVANAFDGIQLPGQFADQQQQQRAAFQAAQQQQQLVLQAAQKAMEDQAQLKAAQNEAIRNPSLANYNRLQVLNPSAHEATKAAYDALKADEQTATLRELSAVRGYLAGGKPQDAARMVQRRIDADRAAGHDTSDDEQMLELINSGDPSAQGLVDYMLAGVMGPDKWASTFETVGKEGRADAAAPGEMASTAADSALKDAQTKEINERLPFIAPQAAATIDKTNAEAGNASAESQQRLQVVSSGPPLSAQAMGAVNTAATSGASARVMGEKATTLADQIASQPATIGAGGAGSYFANALANLGFEASDMTEFRRQYQQLKQQQAIANLPPGPATDRDIKLALAGFPGQNADRDTIISFLRGIAKAQELVATSEEAKADWLSGNSGSLGRANRLFMVNNDVIEPGTTFAEYQRQQIAARARDFAQDQATASDPAPAPRAPARTGPLTGAFPNLVGAQ